MNTYTVPLIAIPKSLQEKLAETGHWQAFYDSCARHGTEVLLLGSRPVSPRLKRRRARAAQMLLA